MGNPLPLVTQSQADRRDFVRGAAASRLLPSFLAGCHEKKEDEGEENISANEDLMREHGILKRVLLAYDEIVRRIEAGHDLPPQTVTDGATIIRKFVEDYHER